MSPWLVAVGAALAVAGVVLAVAYGAPSYWRAHLDDQGG